MQCKDESCKAEIEFVKNPKSGKMMPVEPKRVWILTDDGQIVKGRVCHFSTCPGANKFSGKRKKEAGDGGGSPQAKA